MDSLPIQIIQEIVALPILNIKDVLNLGGTCHRFRELIHGNNYVWKQKFHSKWPQFKKLFNKDFNEWFSETRYIYELSKRTHSMLVNMSAKYYKKKVLFHCHLTEWITLSQESSRGYQYVAYDLMSIIENVTPIKTIEVVPIDTRGNITLQYYATNVLRFIRHCHLSKKWEEFVALPELDQTLEKAAVFISQWFEIRFDLEYIEHELDNYAKQVIKRLKIVNPAHPLHKMSPQTLEIWKNQNLEINQWNNNESQEIIQSLLIVFYDDLKFVGNNIFRNFPNNSFINKVLRRKSGEPIILSIIYESIARRLGLKYELQISFPNYFLKFTDKFNSDNYYYIDIFKQGQITSEGSVPISTRKAIEVFATDLRDHYEQYTHTDEKTQLFSSLRLLHLIEPLDIGVITDLICLYVNQDVATRSLEEYLMNHIDAFDIWFDNPEQIYTMIPMIQRLRNCDIYNINIISEITPNYRTENLKYAVGMVMKHIRLGYICVIYDWDLVCNKDDCDLEQGVHKLWYKDQQPFYKVLLEDNVHHYVAQENLRPTTNPHLLHLNEDLGRHFSHFFECHFVPNPKKEMEFPEDTPIRHRYHHEMKFYGRFTLRNVGIVVIIILFLYFLRKILKPKRQ